MSNRMRIAFATCPSQAPFVQRVAPRFAAIAEVEAYPSVGREAEAVAPALVDAAPHVVIADPKPAACLADRVKTTVVPFEFAADRLMERIEEALQEADTVAVMPLAGTVSPSVERLLKRAAGAVHVFSWDNYAHLRDLIVRARRMGVQAVIGGEKAASLARQEGMKGLSLYDGPDEPEGVIAQMILKAAAQCAPRILGRKEELAAYGLVLEKICQGAIGPHDTALCLDARGLVTATFAHRCHDGGEASSAPALPTGVPLMEALELPACRAAAGGSTDDRPLSLDVYPLAEAGSDGYVVVVRGEPRLRGAAGGDACGAGPGGERVETLLRRVEALVERADALAPAGRTRAAPRRLLASVRRRTFLLDWRRVRYFELRSGLVYAGLAGGEVYATNYTLADILARVDPADFFRIHRHVIVNLNYVTEIERYGAGQLRLLLDGPDASAFVASRPASAALRKLLKY